MFGVRSVAHAVWYLSLFLRHIKNSKFTIFEIWWLEEAGSILKHHSKNGHICPFLLLLNVANSSSRIKHAPSGAKSPIASRVGVVRRLIGDKHDWLKFTSIRFCPTIVNYNSIIWSEMTDFELFSFNSAVFD